MKTITVGDKSIDFDLTADFLIGYREAFKEDGLVAMQEMSEMSDGQQIEFAQRIAYVMSGADLEGKSFREWLRGFNFADFFNATEEILQVMVDAISPLSSDGGETEGTNTKAAEN